ncbi:MAG TPA: 3-hydroxyacyl-CoA dehydrogenase NAD-binding domain-containing protein, partial [Flavisolibacter sp.]|nr:3-hydroxyacyl-CoA dehydrogenase NAD-binding domain-containing protein [Flavisolibacter sp.]
IAVIGAGTMGNGISHVFAQNGFSVSLVDVSSDQLDKAKNTISTNLQRQLAKGSITEETQLSTINNISFNTSLQTALQNVELVVEAASESIEVKLSLFKQLDQFAPPHCILATNTSSISITRIASVTNRPQQVIGMHFMNPVPVMKLVEIINGYQTQPDVTNAIFALSRHLGKTPCIVNDYPGFVANRILMPMINEAVYTLFEGVAGVEEIDTVMKLGMSHPMGPLQLADFIGLDVCLSILNVLYEGFANPKYAPCPLLANMVMAKKLGVKSGEGFYVYSAGSKDAVISDRFR